MKYREYMGEYKLSTAAKGRIYRNVMAKANEKKKTTQRWVFAFATVLIVIAALGTGLFFITQNKAERENLTYALAFSGTYDKSRIPFGIEDFDESGEINVKIETPEQLKEFAENNGMPFYDENDVNYDSALSKKIREYDDDFFKEKALIAVFRLEKEYDMEQFSEMKLDGEVLTVYLSKPEGNASYTEISAFIYIIETQKKFVEKVSEIRTDVQSAGEWTDYTGKTYYQIGGYYEDGEKSPEELVRKGILSEEDLAAIYEKSGFLRENGQWTYRSYPRRTSENDPDALSEERKYRIIQSLIDELVEKAIAEMYAVSEEEGRQYEKMLEKMNPYKYELLKIDRYYGTYNDCIAVGIHQSIGVAGVTIDLLVVWRLE